MKRYLWVIEVFDSSSCEWMSTMHVALARRLGREMLRGARERNPDWKYQLVRYWVEE